MSCCWQWILLHRVQKKLHRNCDFTCLFAYDPWALGVETKQSRSFFAYATVAASDVLFLSARMNSDCLLQDAEEDMKKMAARTPVKEGGCKDEKPGSKPPATKKRRNGDTRLRRRLFETPTKESPGSVGDASPVTPAGESEEDRDLFHGEFRRRCKSSLPEKRKALNRAPSRSKCKRRRPGSSPGPSTAESAAKASEVPGDFGHEDDDDEAAADDDDDERDDPAPLLNVPTAKKEPKQEAKPAEAPPSEVPKFTNDVESEVLQSLPSGLSQ